MSAVLESAGPPVRMEELAGLVPTAGGVRYGEVLAGAIRSVMPGDPLAAAFRP